MVKVGLGDVLTTFPGPWKLQEKTMRSLPGGSLTMASSLLVIFLFDGVFDGKAVSTSVGGKP